MKPGMIQRFFLVPLRFIGYHLGFGLRRGWEAGDPNPPGAGLLRR